LTQSGNIQIAPAEGKLGVLIPGMGAVTTTFLAGLDAIRRGWENRWAPLLSGKRTDGRSPAIKSVVPLAKLEDLVGTGTSSRTRPTKPR
jgi:myo-inositol-1-phosphate synthase